MSSSRKKKEAKTLLSCILILLIAISSLVVYTSHVSGESFGIVTADGVRVRSNADTSTSSNIVGHVYTGDRVTVLGSTKGNDGATWYKIKVSGSSLQGYMHGDYLKVYDDSSGGEILNDKEFEQALADEGFPESYKADLRSLHARYPKWHFQALHTGINWDDAVYKQTHPVNRSLVSGNSRESWKSVEPGAYDPKTGEYTVFDSGGWVAASQAIVEYYMDPRNSLDDTTIFQFLSNTYDPSTQTLSALNSVISTSFLSGKFPESGYSSYADLIMSAGKRNNVNPLTIASMIINEQGWEGKSDSISGTVAGYEGYYNFLNVGASAYGGRSAIINGLIYAKNKGWYSRVRSINGGTAWYKNNYVKQNKYTLYLQRFNVMNGLDSVGTMQYMTAIWGANSEGISLAQGYKDNMEEGITFAIPVYLNMPSSPCPLPGEGSNLNYLKSLSVSGYRLTPTFDRNKTKYEVIVPNSRTSIKVSAEAESSAATIRGTGSYSLKVGKNPIKITCTSSSGNPRTYVIDVIRKEDSGSTVDPTPIEEVYPTSSVYKMTSELTGVTPKTSFNTFISNFSKGTGSVRVYDARGRRVSSGYVAAGMVCKTYDSQGRRVKSLPIVLRGDANGDGDVNIKDCICILNHVVGRSKIGGALHTSADANRDGAINIKDSIKILNHVVGRSKLKF